MRGNGRRWYTLERVRYSPGPPEALSKTVDVFGVVEAWADGVVMTRLEVAREQFNLDQARVLRDAVAAWVEDEERRISAGLADTSSTERG